MTTVTLEEMSHAGNPAAGMVNKQSRQIDLAITAMVRGRTKRQTSLLLQTEFEISQATAYRRMAEAEIILKERQTRHIHKPFLARLKGSDYH